MNKKIVLIIACLLLGLTVDFLSGKDAYILFGLSKNISILTSPFIGSFLSDILWAIAFALSLSCFSDEHISNAIAVIFTGAVLEILQRLNIVSGTGDIFDVIAETMSVIAVTLLLKEGLI